MTVNPLPSGELGRCIFPSWIRLKPSFEGVILCFLALASCLPRKPFLETVPLGCS